MAEEQIIVDTDASQKALLDTRESITQLVGKINDKNNNDARSILAMLLNTYIYSKRVTCNDIELSSYDVGAVLWMYQQCVTCGNSRPEDYRRKPQAPLTRVAS